MHKSIRGWIESSRCDQSEIFVSMPGLKNNTRNCRGRKRFHMKTSADMHYRRKVGCAPWKPNNSVIEAVQNIVGFGKSKHVHEIAYSAHPSTVAEYSLRSDLDVW